MTKVLVIEDDPRIASFLKRGLEAEGYVIDVADNGEDAMAMASDFEYPLIILDRMLPQLDGLEVCRRLRHAGLASLVLMLTAKDALGDRIDGLRSGADDYLTKPFAFDELLARMEALLRRHSRLQPAREVLHVGDLTLDRASHTVTRGGREIALTAREFALLQFLMENAGTVLSRPRLLSNVWNYGFDPGTKVVDVYIRYLRRKIDAGTAEPLIRTVRGVGYVLSAAPELPTS